MGVTTHLSDTTAMLDALPCSTILVGCWFLPDCTLSPAKNCWGVVTNGYYEATPRRVAMHHMHRAMTSNPYPLLLLVVQPGPPALMPVMLIAKIMVIRMEQSNMRNKYYWQQEEWHHTSMLLVGAFNPSPQQQINHLYCGLLPMSMIWFMKTLLYSWRTRSSQGLVCWGEVEESWPAGYVHSKKMCDPSSKWAIKM